MSVPPPILSVPPIPTEAVAIVPHSVGYLSERRAIGFWPQYILNPALSSRDFILVGQVFVLIVTLRFLVAGIYSRQPIFGQWQSIFQRLFKSHIRIEKKRKFSENLWYFCWHTSSFVWNLYVLYRESVRPFENGGGGLGWPARTAKEWTTQWYFIPTPAEEALGNIGWPLLTVSTEVRTFYLTELGFWLSCLAYIGLETIRDDLPVMLVHHSVTLILIMCSYLCSYWRVGLMVLLAHDIGDVFLYLAKTLHYSLCKPVYVDLLFIGFVITFFVSRLIFFPLFCLRPVVNVRQFDEWTNGAIKSLFDVPGGIVGPIAMGLLQAIHVFWFCLIVRMALRTLKTKTVTTEGDIRSDDEASDENNSESELEDLSRQKHQEGDNANITPPTVATLPYHRRRVVN